jgi:hypothetical protein
MSNTIQAFKNPRTLPKTGGRGEKHKDEPRDKVVRIRSKLFKEIGQKVQCRL